VEHITIPFSPRPWQRKTINKIKRRTVLVVHRGAGKTVLCVNVLNREAITGPHDAVYAYILPTYTQAKKVVWKALQTVANAIPGVVFNNSELKVSYPNGSIIYLLGAENPDALRGLHLHGVILDEFSEHHPDTWSVVRPMLTNHFGWCIWIGTPKGNQNEFYKKWCQSQDPKFIARGWYGELLTWKDTNALSLQEIEDTKLEMPPETFAQEMECSFTSALRGAYWANMVDKLYHDKRMMTGNLFNPNLPVNTAWDLGYGKADLMSVWFFQIPPVGTDINIINYAEEMSLGFPEWVKILNYYKTHFKYNWGIHYAPHDIQKGELATGVSRLEAAKELGIKFERVPVTQDKMAGILNVRQNIHRCKFDVQMCEDGLAHLRNYKAKLDKLGNDLGPLHDKHSHGADAFRTLWDGLKMRKPTPATQSYKPYNTR
jgi:phage terminase large subunit